MFEPPSALLPKNSLFPKQTATVREQVRNKSEAKRFFKIDNTRQKVTFGDTDRFLKKEADFKRHPKTFQETRGKFRQKGAN